MLIFLGVENFAKIESAKVCINSYTLLAGPNNSGKTYLMQLIQGVNERLANLVEEDALKVLECEGNSYADYTKYVISQHNILNFTACLNERLEAGKQQIIKEIYGKDIAIGKLYVEISLEADEKYEILLFKHVNAAIEMDGLIGSVSKNFFNKIDDSIETPRICFLIEYSEVKKEGDLKSLTMISENESVRIIKSILKNILQCRSLFFPASRTGLILLYRDFFANKADDMVSYQIQENQFIENKNNYGELTQPVYQFLRFLQTYSESEERKRYYKNEIDFFEEKLIEGHISTSKQKSFFYASKADHVSIPMYMASSMINEIAPFVLALTAGSMYDGLIIDEIEASLHPQKQLELVKFLNRLSNKGVKLLMSTHSDTFASKINNLYILSNYIKQKKRDDIIKKMGMEKEDLMDPDKLFVYEFINQSDGHSVVREISGDSRTGFQFDLFTDSAMNLYNEALEIGEIVQNDKSQP